MTEPCTQASSTVSEEQPELFSGLPPIKTVAETPQKISRSFDPMYPSGEPEFPGWDPNGIRIFHGPASD
jgi:hypothetical protein